MVVIESMGTDQVASREERRFYGRDPKDYHHLWSVQRSLRKSSQRMRRKPERARHQEDQEREYFKRKELVTRVE